MPAARFTTTRVMERIASVRSDWSVETQSSAMFVSLRLDCSLYCDLIITSEEHMAIVAVGLS